MTTPAADNGSPTTWRPRSVSDWLSYAAAPTFVLMGLIAAIDMSPMALCSSAGVLRLDGMTVMYLLMSLFHLPPWLKLASTARRASNPQPKETDHDPSNRFA